MDVTIIPSQPTNAMSGVTTNLDGSTTVGTGTDADSFPFPVKTYNFPPFFTLQPTQTTRQAQLRRWSSLVQDYCRFHRIFSLSIVEARDRALFHNVALKKRLAEKDIRTVIEYMLSKDGDERAEWVDGSTKSSAWIWWRKLEEWGELIWLWVDTTGQKGSVLTLYEIIEGDVSIGQDFHGMPVELLVKSLTYLTKKGKAQIFGMEDQQGVKFF